MPLRVLVSAYACRPGFGSEPGIGWNWAAHLADAGLEVWLLTRADNREAIESAAAEPRRANLRFVYVEGKPRRSILRFLPWHQYLTPIQWQKQAYEIAAKLEREIGFDVAHHVSYGSLQTGSLLWRLDCPFIFGPVGGGQTAPAGFRRHLQGGWLLECMRTVMARHLNAVLLNARSTVTGSMMVLVANRDTETAVRKIGARDVRFMTDIGLTTNQIATARSISSPQMPLQILWVARLLPRKGLLLALEALSLVDKNTAWKLTIIGDGKQGAMLPKWLKRYRLNDKVEWRGRIPWQDVQTSYDGADLFLFTSLRDTNGGQLLEAMGRGVPILTLDHHGASTLVPDAAGIKVRLSTPKETAERLAHAVELLAADRTLLLGMSAAATDAARNHTWSGKVTDALKMYQEVIRLKSRASAKKTGQSANGDPGIAQVVRAVSES